jgi:hypothetical protein
MAATYSRCVGGSSIRDGISGEPSSCSAAGAFVKTLEGGASRGPGRVGEILKFLDFCVVRGVVGNAERRRGVSLMACCGRRVPAGDDVVCTPDQGSGCPKSPWRRRSEREDQIEFQLAAGYSVCGKWIWRRGQLL